MSDDPHNLQRFVDAQDHRNTWATALDELRRGRKHSHWMWFVFPQLAGLGRSATAQRYAIASLAEARVYAAHPVLGPRLVEGAQALLDLPAGASANQILGGIDALKLHSSMTLFARSAPDRGVFAEVLRRYYDARTDPGTDELLDLG